MSSFTLSKDRLSAKRLREDIKLHKNDLNWIKEHKAIVYAVDNNIALLFSNPKLVAFENKYTKVFLNDEEINVVSLGKVLSYFIFYKLSDQNERIAPKLLIPPLDREFARIFQAAFNNSTKELQSAKKKAEAIEAMVIDSNLSDSEIAKKLVEQAPEILEILYGENSSATVVRKLCALIDEHKLTSLVEITSNNSEGLPEDFVAAYLKKKSITEMIWTSTLKEEWIKKLDKPSLDDKKREKIADDAEALASLQLINARLAGSGIRFVMITGAPNILRVAEKIKVTEAGESYTFNELWLRHPRCFLGDSNIISTSLSDNKDNELQEILDGFLAGIDEKKPECESYIGQQISSSYPLEIEEFQKAWNKFTANISLENSKNLDKASWYDQNQVAIDLIKKLRSVEVGLRQLLKESWKTVFLAAIQTGFLYTWSLEKIRERNLPKLIFEDFHEASQFIEEILSYTPGSVIDNFQHKINKVKDDNSKGYTTYLVFGILFAAQNNWHMADTLADYSLKIIYPDPSKPLEIVRADPKRVLTGREGFYLKAVAGRHLAKSASDLTVTYRAIYHAIDILQYEREIHPEVIPNDTRFQYELCCINVAAYMFEKFLDDTPNFYIRLSPDEIKASLLNILEITHKVNDNKFTDSKASICCQRLTPFFIVELTLIHNIGDSFPPSLFPYLQMFRELFNDEHRVNPTTLTRVVFSIVDWWGETSIDKKKIKQKIAVDEIKKSRLALKQDISMPYEFKRHNYFEQFVGLDIAV